MSDATVSAEALMCILNHAIGVIGYFDGRVTGVEITNKHITVSWTGAAANCFPLVFDHDGNLLRDDVNLEQ